VRGDVILDGEIGDGELELFSQAARHPNGLDRIPGTGWGVTSCTWPMKVVFTHAPFERHR
jgi:hypothetical protein